MSVKADTGPMAAGARHLHTLGPRALAHFLAEIGAATGTTGAIVAKLEDWRGLSADAVYIARGDAFPPPPLGVVRTGTDR